MMTNDTKDLNYYNVLNRIANYRDHMEMPIWNFDFKKFVCNTINDAVDNGVIDVDRIKVSWEKQEVEGE